VFDHVTIRVTDRDASDRFYTTVLRPLGLEPSFSEMGPEWDEFSLTGTDAEHPPTRHLHIGFAARTREDVDAFWRAGIAAGYESDGDPGPRPQYREDYYGAFLLDPDGNSAEAVHHAATPGRCVDHVWLRVDDKDASRDFYALVAQHAGFELKDPQHVQFVGERGSFSLVSDDRPRTNHVHLAFPAPDEATVDAFHAALTHAGYADNGPPGERPQYHPGYYGAFVLDPDGHNVELVHHRRE
jgi:catechol 2,3-dioxygenase-like lactoylglutathione lyase family enzyme